MTIKDRIAQLVATGMRISDAVRQTHRELETAVTTRHRQAMDALDDSTSGKD